MTEMPQPETANNNASDGLEPHRKLEEVAARLAASVGDASELVSAARMLQNDGERERESEREKERTPAFFPPSFFLFLR